MSSESIHIDRALLKRASEGDQHAFTVLYESFKKLIYNRALAYLQSAELAEDVVQEVFIKIWNYRQKLPEINNIKSFIFVVARNVIISDLRRKVFYSHLDAEEQLEMEESVLPDKQLSLKEAVRAINESVEALPPQQKTAFKLSRNEGLSYEQIAAEMKISPLTVKTHISKALQSIRLHLSNHSIDLALIVGILFIEN